MRLAVSESLLNVCKGTWKILYTPWARGVGTIGPGGKGWGKMQTIGKNVHLGTRTEGDPLS